MTSAPTRPALTRPALTRSIPFWILLVASIGLAIGGTVVIGQHLATMTKTLGDGSATGLEVYAGQSWIVVGAALLGAGALGVLLTLALAAAAAFVPAASARTDHAPALPADVTDPDGALDAAATAQEIATAGIPAAEAGTPEPHATDATATNDDAADDDAEKNAVDEPTGAVSAR